jgi:peptidoglycan/LPS O-acetylase OafA/YrhL
VLAIVTALLLILNLHRFVTLVIIPFAAMLWFLTFEESRLRRWLEWRGMVLFGGASYSIYILQDPLRNWAALFNDRWIHVPAMVTALYPCVLVAVSVVVFLGLEEPARGWIRALALVFRRRWVFAAPGAVSIHDMLSVYPVTQRSASSIR